jgi:integrase
MPRARKQQEKADAAKETRRGHGEGTKYKRADGYWIGQITTGKTDEGKQERKTFSAKSEKDLVAKMKEYQYKQMRGELPKKNTVSLGDWLTTWLENYKRPKVRQTTYENYDTLIKTHILKAPIGKVQVQKLTTDQIQQFMRVLSERGKKVTVKEEVEEDGKKVIKKRQEEVPLSSRAIDLIHFLIQAALEQARKNNMVSYNVAKDCERHKDEKKEVKPLTKDEEKALLMVLKDHRLYAAILLADGIGLRRGELLALRWPNVDLEEGVIKIAENLVRVKGGSKVQPPKTKSSNRTIPLPARVTEALKAHKARQEEEKAKSEEKAKGSYQDNGLVFCQPSGKPIQPRNFQRMFKGWAKKAGLPEGTRLHDLRHTFSSNALAAGADVKAVQSITGHSDTRTLMDTYAHAINEGKKKVADIMNGQLPEV